MVAFRNFRIGGQPPTTAKAIVLPIDMEESFQKNELVVAPASRPAVARTSPSALAPIEPIAVSHPSDCGHSHLFD